MTYTPFILFGLGLFGILVHNLKKLNEINRKNKGTVNWTEYFALERFSILMSIGFVGFLVIVKSEYTSIDYISKLIGTFFALAGYSAQSIILSATGAFEVFTKNKVKQINEE